MVVVRSAFASDADDLAARRLEMLLEFSARGGCDLPNQAEGTEQWLTRTTLWLKSKIRDRDLAAFVAEDRPGKLHAISVGYAWLTPRLPDLGGKTSQAYVSGMFTAPEFRRQGYGAMVLERILRWASENRAGYVELHSSAAGEPFYRKFGFEPYPYGVLRKKL